MSEIQPSKEKISDERLKMLARHYMDQLPIDHPLYGEGFKRAEAQTAEALLELVAARGLLKEARLTLEQRIAHEPGTVHPDTHLIDTLGVRPMLNDLAEWRELKAKAASGPTKEEGRG